jgi:predicted ATPase
VRKIETVRVTRLKLQNWRNFKQVEVALDHRAFFIGPNASGKSNLLEAFRFLRDIVSVGGGLEEAVRMRGSVSEIRSFSATRNANILLEVDLGDDDHPVIWRYLLEFQAQEKTRGPIVVREKVWDSEAAKPLLDRPDKDDRADNARLSQTALQQVSANKAFRPIADFLASIRYLHVVPQIVRDTQRSSGRDDPYGGDFIERINTTNKKTRDTRLKRMEEALRIAVPQLSNLELEVDKKGVPHLRAKYNHWRPQGAWQREDRFSDGTLRLLGLIWALQERGGPLLLEEPELSLNPGVVAKLGPMISRATKQSERQVLITTHSADLLSDGVDLSEVHLLSVSDQGTAIMSAESLADVRRLVDNGIPLGEAILPKAKAKEADRLSLLDLTSP